MIRTCSFAIRPLRARCSVLWAIFLLGFLGSSTLIASGQEQDEIALEGYITAVHPPNSFDVNGKHAARSTATQYGEIGMQDSSTNSPLIDSLQVGAYVEVKGPTDRHTKITSARFIYFREDWDRKLSGIGVIDKVIATGPQLVFRADGYLLSLAPTTDLTFSEELNSLADVGTNTWVRYEGKRDATGALLVSKAVFLPAKPTKFKAVPYLEVSKVTVKPPQVVSPSNVTESKEDSSESPESQHKASSGQPDSPASAKKERFSERQTRLRLIGDPALQERLRRIGFSVVPDYQKALTDDNPSKIQFQFRGIDNLKYRTELCTIDGQVLVPKAVLDRLKNDDQLAAVLADGVAFHLQRQAARLVSGNRVEMGVEAAGDIAGAFVPGLGLAAFIGSNVAGGQTLIRMQEQRSRVSLALMNDAGYDLLQAPEAWRLLAPKHLLANLDSLSYPNISGYQLSIVNQQYRGHTANSGLAATTASTSR